MPGKHYLSNLITYQAITLETELHEFSCGRLM